VQAALPDDAVTSKLRKAAAQLKQASAAPPRAPRHVTDT
jgi:hypothetical protein